MTTTADIGTNQAPPARGVFDAGVRLLRRRWVVVVAVLAGALLAGVLLTALWKPPYEARAVLQVQTASAGSLQNVSFDLFYTDRLLNTYTELAESDRLHDELVSELGADGQVDLEAAVPANTELLVVEASADDPDMAAAAASALATRLVDDIRQNLSQRFDAAREALRLQLDGIEQRIVDARAAPASSPDTIDDLLIERDSLVRSYNEALSLGAASVSGVSIVQPAVVPTERSVGPTLILGLAALFGIVGGVLMALAVDRADRTIFDVPEAVVERGHPVLGDLEPAETANPAETSALTPQAIGVAFRLRQTSPRSLLFASAFTQPSTARVVADLTRALASTGVEVVAVDAALTPSLHTLFDTPDRPGLQEALRYGKPLAELALPTRYPHVHLVPGGHPNGASVNAIETFWGLDQLNSLTDAFDLVVVYASPLLESAETLLLGRSVEATVLVLDESRMHEADLDAALEQVTALPSTFLGTIAVRSATRRTSRLRRRRSRS